MVAALLVLPVVVVECSASELPWINLATGVDWLISRCARARRRPQGIPEVGGAGRIRRREFVPRACDRRLIQDVSPVATRSGPAVAEDVPPRCHLEPRWQGSGAVVRSWRTRVDSCGYGDHRPLLRCSFRPSNRPSGRRGMACGGPLLRRPRWDMATYPRSRSWVEFLRRS